MKRFVALREPGREDATLVRPEHVEAISPVKLDSQAAAPRCDLVLASGVRLQVSGEPYDVGELLAGEVWETGITFVGMEESGKLHLRLNVNFVSGEAYMSREFWEELGRRAGWM